MKHKLIKALIWILGLLVADAIITARFMEWIQRGALPTLILFILTYALPIWICSTVCTSYDEKYGIDWCDHCGKKLPLTPYQGKLLDNGNHEWLHLCDKCLRELQNASPVDASNDAALTASPSGGTPSAEPNKTGTASKPIPFHIPDPVPTPAPEPAPKPAPAPVETQAPASAPVRAGSRRRGLRALDQNELLALVSGILAVLIMLLILVIVVKFYL